MVSSSTRGSCNIFPKLPLSWDFPAAQQPKIRRRRAVATWAAASNKYLARLGVRPLTWQRQHNRRTNTAAMPGMMMIISRCRFSHRISGRGWTPNHRRAREWLLASNHGAKGVQKWKTTGWASDPLGSRDDWSLGWFVSNQGNHHHHTGVVQATWCHREEGKYQTLAHWRGLIPPVIPLHECQFVAQKGPTIWNLFNGKM